VSVLPQDELDELLLPEDETLLTLLELLLEIELKVVPEDLKLLELFEVGELLCELLSALLLGGAYEGTTLAKEDELLELLA
jgi:hypothetical protein